MRPCARQVPKTDARVILVSVPRGERVPPLTLRHLVVSRKVSGGVVVRWDCRFGHEDEEFFDVLSPPGAQLGLDC